MLAISYDKRHDMLYAKDPDGGFSYGQEDDDGTIIYRSISTDALTGIAVYSISKKLKDTQFKLSKLPVPLDQYKQKIYSLVLS